MTDEGKIKCKLCNYKGHKPMLRKHLYWAHGIEFIGKRFYAINELPKNKWLKIIGTYEKVYDNEVIWYYEEIEK